MNSKVHEIEGINIEMLSRYLEMRNKLNKEANSIFAVTSMLSQYDKFGDDKIEVDPAALGNVHQILNNNILNIWEILENYIPIVQAKLALRKFEE